MAWGIELRNDLYASLPRISQYLNVILLGKMSVCRRGHIRRIYAAVVRREQVISLHILSSLILMREGMISAIGSKFRELRNLESPAFIVTEMKMENICLVMG